MAIDPEETRKTFLDIAQDVESPFVESPFVLSPVVGGPSLLDNQEELAPTDLSIPLWKQRMLQRRDERRENRMLENLKGRYLGSENNLQNLKGLLEDIGSIANKYTDFKLRKYMRDTYDLVGDEATIIKDLALSANTIDWGFLELPEGQVSFASLDELDALKIDQFGKENVQAYESTLAEQTQQVASNLQPYVYQTYDTIFFNDKAQGQVFISDATLPATPNPTNIYSAAAATGVSYMGVGDVINKGVVSLGNAINDKAAQIVAGGAVNEAFNNTIYGISGQVPLPPGADAAEAMLATEKLKMDTQFTQQTASLTAQLASTAGAILSIDSFLENPSFEGGLSVAAAGTTAYAAWTGSMAAAQAAAVLNPIALGIGVVSYISAKRKGSTYGHAIIGYTDGEFKMTSESSKNKGFRYTIPEANKASVVLNELVKTYGFKVDQDKVSALDMRVDFDKTQYTKNANSVVADAIKSGAIYATEATPEDMNWKQLFTDAVSAANAGYTNISGFLENRKKMLEYYTSIPATNIRAMLSF